MFRIVIGFLVFLLPTAPASAEQILLADFQSGTAAGWIARGSGDVRVTQYQSNYSLRLQSRAEALTAFRGTDKVNIAVSAQIAAQGLGPRDACLVEASADKGLNWFEIGRVEKGQDDAVTFYNRRAIVPALAGADPAYIRLRAELNNTDAACWFDTILADGRAESAETRTQFSPAFLLGNDKLNSPRDLSVFAPPARVASGASLNGTIKITPIGGSGGSHVLVDRANYAPKSPNLVKPPLVEIGMISDGATLIPAFRSPIKSDHQDWEWIISPGTSWTEPDDAGWSRAAIPFALQERNANCTHNGMLTFLYRADGSTSRAAWEVVGETCAYLKLDMWGMATVNLNTEPLKHGDLLVKAHRVEVASRVPTRPIAEIGSIFPGVSPMQFESASEINPANMTAFGVFAGGIHWVGECMTRYGAYPFCDVLALPSYSLAKSMVGGLGLMRLELLYPGSSEEFISSNVRWCGGSKWTDVTLSQALNMTTGNYDKLGYDLDESGEKMPEFFAADSRDERARLACAMFPRQAVPGTQWVYHTIDTYLLGVAMQNILKRRKGTEADIYSELIVDPIWRKIGLSPVLDDTKRSYDDARQPFVGWGLTMHRDDAVRFAQFVAGGALENGKAVVDPKMLAAALQRNPANRGAEAGSPDQRYKNGFWGWNISRAINCPSAVWVPFLSGFGGISIAMFPNGVIYYYFSDGHEYAWRQAALGANAITPMCGK